MNLASAKINWDGRSLNVDLSSPIDTSLAIKDSRVEKGASAWYVDGPRFEPVRGEDLLVKFLKEVP